MRLVLIRFSRKNTVSWQLYLQVYGAEFSKHRQKFMYRCADKSLARPGETQATAIEDFDFHISYL